MVNFRVKINHIFLINYGASYVLSVELHKIFMPYAELDQLYDGCLIVNGFSISVQSIWKHREDAVPTIIMDDLPDGTSADSLEVYLEGQQVDINSVTMSGNGQTACIELKRYSGKYVSK